MLVLVLTLVSAGCQQVQLERTLHDGPPTGAGGGASSKLRREWAMNQQWQNRHFSELAAALGEPLLIMQIPGGGSPPGFAAVYGRDPATGCIDAFAFLNGGDPIIRIYHCR